MWDSNVSENEKVTNTKDTWQFTTIDILRSKFFSHNGKEQADRIQVNRRKSPAQRIGPQGRSPDEGGGRPRARTPASLSPQNCGAP